MLESLRNTAATSLAMVARRLYVSGDPETSRVYAPQRVLAGVRMTADTAITVSAAWAACRYLSQTVAQLPWHCMRPAASGKGSELVPSNPVDWLIYARPNEEWSSFAFRETMMHWALRWGNGYAEITRDALGRPTGLYPIHPERVKVARNKETGVLQYEVSNDFGGGGAKVIFDRRDIFHIKGFSEEGPVGVGIMEYAAQSIGWARAAQLFGAAFFGNGANVAGVVVNKKPLDPDGLKRQKAEFDALTKGVGKAHRTVFIDNDAEWKRMGLDAKETQLVEVHQFLVEEVCRWFGVPPHKVAHLLRATFSNIEHQAIEVVVDSIVPWVKRFEDEADDKLFGEYNRGRLYTKMNLRGLLRGDFKSQNEGLQIARINGVITTDEWREYLDMNPIGGGRGGDKLIIQANNTTLEKVGEEPVAPAGAAPADDSADDPVVEARLAGLLEGIDGRIGHNGGPAWTAADLEEFAHV